MYVRSKNKCLQVAFNCYYFLLVSAMKRKDIERIYEQKNYAYLRPEQMKSLRLVSKLIPDTDADSDTSPDQKSGEKKP